MSTIVWILIAALIIVTLIAAGAIGVAMYLGKAITGFWEGR